MPCCVAEPEWRVNPQPSEATLGTTLNVNSVPPGKTRAPTLSELPREIHLNIMAHLDPVSQMCLGLCSQIFHRTFHTIYGEGKKWNIKTYPFSLAMQTSVCGEYVLNWIWEDWFLRDSKDIMWGPTLGQLLWKERIWGGLICCWECLKYKPTTAFAGFEFETKVLEKHRGRIARMEREEVAGYWNLCRRCRAELLFSCLESSQVVYEDGEVWEYRKSLGLRRLEERKKVAHSATWAEWHAALHNYDRWEDIFAELGI